MEILVGLAKMDKQGSIGGSDGFEVAERPGGGISIILAEGVGNGRSSQDVCRLVAIKAALLISDGVRDAMVSRAIHDYLHAEKDGKIAVMLTIISINTEAQNISVVRNSVCPVFVRHEFAVDRYDETGVPLGIQKAVKPIQFQTSLNEGMLIATFSDGVMLAGRKQGRRIELEDIERLLEKNRPEDVQYIAEDILSRALVLDSYQPNDHMAAVCVGISDKQSETKIQLRTVSYPL
jgi:serine phosphatase RsbU (regulator of sigma subunit)